MKTEYKVLTAALAGASLVGQAMAVNPAECPAVFTVISGSFFVVGASISCITAVIGVSALILNTYNSRKHSQQNERMLQLMEMNVRPASIPRMQYLSHLESANHHRSMHSLASTVEGARLY